LVEALHVRFIGGFIFAQTKILVQAPGPLEGNTVPILFNRDGTIDILRNILGDL